MKKGRRCAVAKHWKVTYVRVSKLYEEGVALVRAETEAEARALADEEDVDWAPEDRETMNVEVRDVEPLP